MILQTANIVSGFVLSSSKIKEHEKVRTHVERVENLFLPHRETIGIVVLVLGVVGLLARLGLSFLWFSILGVSYPQAIPAILIGLVLSESRFRKYPAFHKFIVLLTQHQVAIGFVGMASGLGSLLFGCVLPVVCGVY